MIWGVGDYKYIDIGGVKHISITTLKRVNSFLSKTTLHVENNGVVSITNQSQAIEPSDEYSYSSSSFQNSLASVNNE